ncbi:precorrin-2 C(20)-methyltransferase [Thermogymnomonas acidicola]|uniref:precorrin-2 C(20)-methyltransferase n=1 Tax=Thermogymnomonas acidicola TaxID=399579 RepID=UPI0009463FF0|nr:precorrin-2 C(20)-methyltransferase [Thermogymnomonas acidicola]
MPETSRTVAGLAMGVIMGLGGGGLTSKVVRLPFPMTRDERRLEEAWEANSRSIVEALGQGKRCCYAVLGDPMLYSTFGHIQRILVDRYGGVEVEFVPAVSSFTACPARAGLVLGEGKESILITSIENLGLVRDNMEKVDTFILIKGGQISYRETVEALKEYGIGESDTLLYARRCEMESERIICSEAGTFPAEGGAEQDYFSMLVVRRNRR